MTNQKKPRFKIGDTVVITIYGTVGKITSVKFLDNMHVYEVNKSEGLYLESSLQMLSEYEGEITDTEKIDIEYHFFIGDLVKVRGYGSNLFKIMGFRTEIWRYKSDAWEDIIYELSRVSDGEWLEAAEDELTLVADKDSADTFIQKLGLLYIMDKKKKPVNLNKTNSSYRQSEKELLETAKEKQELIDGLLDLYNDYTVLYKLFKDPEYEQVLKQTMRKLKRISKKNDDQNVV
ncbi:hypothetical protein [Bacillus sp. B1-b2]|uniref:hypothetical protein n=1 Tax=Bacillus sp. B1-b2 TaxID=2653201 RepID=UPI00126278A3|nr:hypothetical protein [Bacillus sp. B1-b2]KAB7673033.1 hypothetical protein F9279_01005 [Bacillus sp. B1-b2]